MQQEIITIRDEHSNAEATIAVSLGSNCFRFRVPKSASDSADCIDVLWSLADFESGTCRPSSSGIPILFPYPGRLRGMDFEWNGKSYPQESADKLGNAIHGFVHKQPWRIISQTASSLTTEFHASLDDPSLLERWPADFRIRCRFTVEGTTLSTTFQIDNPSSTPLPFGLGAHPYFRLPISQSSPADECTVAVPIHRQWELDSMLPTGKSETIEEQLANGLQFGDMQFDDVFS
ncbi:MAG: aldose 1-epimerase, partial [Planctomycetales bacterium]|nr:aldose 1-epimerase [Planctomycetales bacterium]